VTRPLVAVFTKNRINPAYVAARSGADRTAERLGALTRHYVPQKPDDPEEQIALIHAALADKVDAFVFTPAHATAVNGAVREINAAGVPIFNIINRMTEGDAVCFAGSNDFRLAFEVADYLCRFLGGRGGVAIVEGTPSAVTNRERVRGFREAIKKHIKIQLLTMISGAYLRPVARSAAPSLLALPVRPDGIICANDDMALGVIDVLSEAGLRIPVVGVNAVPDAITAIKQGTLLATADFDAMKLACIATEAAVRHLRGKRVLREILLPAQIVDRANCAAWDKPIEARDLPRWENVVSA
jgi:ribose transport system substrate-binding protein